MTTHLPVWGKGIYTIEADHVAAIGAMKIRGTTLVGPILCVIGH